LWGRLRKKGTAGTWQEKTIRNESKKRKCNGRKSGLGPKSGLRNQCPEKIVAEANSGNCEWGNGMTSTGDGSPLIQKLTKGQVLWTQKSTQQREGVRRSTWEHWGRESDR